MRILMIHEDVREPGAGGGAESLLRDQTRALIDLGHEVAWWQGKGTLEEAIDSFKPDVCHLMTIHNFLGLKPAMYLQDKGVPHLWHVQDYWPFCGPRMLLVNRDQSCPAVKGVCDNQCGGQQGPEWLECVNKSFVVAGNANTAEIYRRNGLRCDAVVELGIDTDVFYPDHDQRDKDVSIYTHTAWPEQPVKGMHIIEAAVHELDGVEVNLVSGVSRDKVAVALKRAHIHIFPSCYEETFGLCLCEAMASGCACIASDVAGARAQIDDKVTGLLVPPRDPDALREAIVYMLEHRMRRESMGYVASMHVDKDHTLEAMGRRWERAYERC